ncbi:MAG: hypothetical protein MJ252_13320 [archaeon]|nr:hypothetical protein [archaeon]
MDKGGVKYFEAKEKRIEELKEINKKLLEEIEIKKEFFKGIEPKTQSFLKKMQDSYLRDYVINIINMQVAPPLNEETVIDYIGTVENYLNLIKMFDKSLEKRMSSEEAETMDEMSMSKMEKSFRKKVMSITPEVKEVCHSNMKKELKNGNDNFKGNIQKWGTIMANQMEADADLTTIFKKKKSGKIAEVA